MTAIFNNDPQEESFYQALVALHIENTVRVATLAPVPAILQSAPQLAQEVPPHPCAVTGPHLHCSIKREDREEACAAPTLYLLIVPEVIGKAGPKFLTHDQLVPICPACLIKNAEIIPQGPFNRLGIKCSRHVAHGDAYIIFGKMREDDGTHERMPLCRECFLAEVRTLHN